MLAKTCDTIVLILQNKAYIQIFAIGQTEILYVLFSLHHCYGTFPVRCSRIKTIFHVNRT